MLLRTEYERKARTIWQQKGAPPAAKDPKIPKKAARTAEKTALKPIATGPLPEEAGLDINHLPELPDYQPPLDLQFQSGKSLATDLSEPQCFQQLLTPAIVDEIFLQNSAKLADPDINVRSWKLVNSTDIWRYIGCLLYMGVHKESKCDEHWSKTGYLERFMGLTRFQQIHRFFTLRDKTVHPQQENEIFAWPVEPVTSTVKQNCRIMWEPSSHLAIDEAMIPFRGRAHHKVKLPKKPIKEGYKIWVLGDNGYVYDWLWHSRIDGPEDILEKGLVVN
jgi:Transposase IS4